MGEGIARGPGGAAGAVTQTVIPAGEPHPALLHRSDPINRLHTWLAATRPAFLTVSVLPVLAGLAMAGAGRQMDIAEASACKLYSAQAAMDVALEAVQLFGGNGYMAEYQVEQLCRDAKVLQIYGGTDEIQVSQI